MTDDQFVTEAKRLCDLGTDGLPALREHLKGQMPRLIDLAVRGALRAKRAAPKAKPTFVPDDFPDAKAREDALAYWRKERRPDLVAAIEREVDKFRMHFQEGKAASWGGRWRTWYANAPNYNRPPAGSLFSAPVVFAQTTISGWVTRLTIYHGFDEDCPKGTWLKEQWGAPPGSPDCRVPAEAFTQFEGRHGRKIAL